VIYFFQASLGLLALLDVYAKERKRI